jgi:hypothetical protein
VIGLLGENLNDIAIIFIIVLSVYWYMDYDLIRLSGIKRGLRRLNRGVKELEGYDAGNILKLDDMFYIRMDSMLRNAWESCYSDFVYIMNKEKTLNIKEYFNTYNIITMPARRKRAESVPGIISTLGILGTFLSIISGLFRLDVPTIAAEENGISSIIQTMTASFSIFVAAIILSMLFLLLDRQLYHSTVLELNAFLNLVSRKIPMANESGSLELLLREQRSQKAAIENMAASISEQLGAFIDKELVPAVYKSFDNSINRQIAPSIKSMSDMLCNLSEVACNAQKQGMQDMVDSFTDKLMSTMGMEFNKLKEILDSFQEYYGKVQNSTNLLIKNITENIDSQNQASSHAEIVLKSDVASQQKVLELLEHQPLRSRLPGTRDRYQKPG